MVLHFFCFSFDKNAPKKSLAHGIHELLFEGGQEINQEVISQHVSPQEKSFVPVGGDEGERPRSVMQHHASL